MLEIWTSPKFCLRVKNEFCSCNDFLFQNYTGKDFVTCPFNAKHEMPKPEIRHHLAMCPDKAVIEPELDYCKDR